MSHRECVNVALIGQGFMGRGHSNAWGQVNKFFKPPVKAALHTSCGLEEEKPEVFAANWGWQHAASDWKKVVRNDEIDLVDIAAPNYMHYSMATAALAAGKHVACEKPLARTLEEARKLAAAARKARGRTFVWFNYRRCPAVALAHQLVKAGKVGHIRHVRAVYLQDWGTEEVPLAWRFDAKLAGSGSHGDLNAHIIDMTRFVTGQEITEICGAIAETFIKRRRLMRGTVAGGIAAGLKSAARTGKVTVDDAVLFLARFSGGATASFEATRLATGNLTHNGFEINGTKGSLRYYFDRMNELDFYDATTPRAVQGWTTIPATRGGDHPYADAWWPAGHIIGYEHSFINTAYDILRSLGGRKPLVPMADFQDAYHTQRVLEAVMICAREKRWVRLDKVR
jgi:predicted dehydrogenase